MSTAWQIFKMLLWVAIFFLPAALIMLAFGPEAHYLQGRTHLPEWACQVIALVVALIVTGIYVLIVWPRMLGMNRKQDTESESELEQDASRSEECPPEPSSSQPS
jgi:predicted PurR-regulated permease PerM